MHMKRRILLAEDSERTRQSLKELLENDDQVEVETVQDGEKAITALNGSSVGGRTINVNEARPKTERSGGGGGGGGRDRGDRGGRGGGGGGRRDRY